MFGGQSAFGATNTGFGSTPAFGAAPNTSVFGGTANTFGAQQQQQQKPAFGGTTFGGTTGGGLFGASNTSSSGGLFGATNTTTSSTFGATGNTFGQPNTTFGGGGFGQTTQSGGGLFGSTTVSQSGGGGLFSQPATNSFGASTGFGSTTAAVAPTGTAFGGFGAAQAQTGTAAVKFNPVTGQDMMLKSGVQTNINTRHQCIVCMKEYENKSMEELRCEDYMAGRKGNVGTGAPAAGGGLFGAAQPAATGGGLFGAQPAATNAGGVFGQQKPLFGATTGGFGAGTAVSAAPAFGAATNTFGQQPTATQAGPFGAAKPFGQATATSTTTGFGGFGGFGQPQQQAAGGGLFGQQNKPFNTVAPQPAASAGGGFFGGAAAGTSTTTGFGATAATGGSAFGGFGQPQQQQGIGLLPNNQAKPAFGGFGATQPAASAAPAFGGFGAGATTAQSGGGLFGSNNAAKPAFGGFGSTAPATTGFGGFGAGTTATSGGLFGANNQAKPAFSFGGTSTANTGGGFGGFGTNTAGTTSGGLFNNTAKPGGLFGGTGTGATAGGFGTGTTGFGAGTGAFGSSGTAGFGAGGLNFSGTATNQTAAVTAPATNPAVQQQLLMALASSPFGDNPLFKPVVETGKRAELLKPGSTPAGPAAQKVLSANQFKISPHRNIKVRTKPVDSNKSSMFEGLDDDLPSSSELFVPRSSVKKLVLRSKKSNETTNNSLLASLGDDPCQESSLTVPLDDLLVKKPDLPPGPDNDNSITVDESFAALNTRKKVAVVPAVQDLQEEKDDAQDKSGQNTSQDSNESDKEDEDGTGTGVAHPGGIVLKRSGYYTIPGLADIVPDADGNCLVEGFTIGREGYGNIHYPGTTNITGLNLDEIVFFRHKEVIVYPDDSNKPPLGEALNKKAQITLDKVWPTDKSASATGADSSNSSSSGHHTTIRSPDRLRSMNYEDKLIRASTRIGARFIEYRPETGSWVFKVDHFSKYGLDDSDEDDIMPPATGGGVGAPVVVVVGGGSGVANANIPTGGGVLSDSLDNTSGKKMKTLHLEKRRTTLDQQQGSSTTLENRNNQFIINGEQLDNMRGGNTVEVTESDGGQEDSGKDVEMNDLSASILQQKTFLRSALFCGGLEDGEMIECPPAKPIILQHRNITNSLMETRPRLIEDMSSSLMGSSTSKFDGLGGSFVAGGDPSLGSSLLKSQYSTQLSNQTTLHQSRSNQSMQSMLHNNNKYSRLPSYSLTSGYDKFTQLQSSISSTGGTGQDTSELVTPQFVDAPVPLQQSYFSKRYKLIADSGLFQNKRFRVGFHNCLELADSQGDGLVNLCRLENKDVHEWELSSLENWLQVAFENSERNIEEGGPVFRPMESLSTLHTHYLEAYRQLQECTDEEQREKLHETKHTWDLMVALWGKINEQQEDNDHKEDMEEDNVRDRIQQVSNVEVHRETVARRVKFSAWLEQGVQPTSRRQIRGARERNDYLGRVRGMLCGGQVEEACEVLQKSGDHRTALLMAQLGGGGTTSRLVAQQLQQWTEVNADKHIAEDKIRLLSLVAGQPVHQGWNANVNTCSRLDWQTSLANHLWFLTHPLSSVSDTLRAFDAAWQGEHAYSSLPHPKYLEDPEGSVEPGNTNSSPLDIKYHLIKLYSDRSHKLESVLSPTSHTSDLLDFRKSWLIYRVLESLGYRMAGSTCSDRLCTDFADQLEQLGLWDWAVFVLLHITNKVLREASVMRVLERRVTLDTDQDGHTREDWVVTSLGVPAVWVARARAVLARSLGKHTVLAEQLLLAGDWNEAHKVIIAEIAPSAILAQNYNNLEAYLRQLSDVAEKIRGWESEGNVYLQFINVDTAVNRFLQERDVNNLGYELERLKPLVTNLCRTISNLPVNNTKQRLAQSEIAKKVAHFMRAVYSFESSGVGASSGGGLPAAATARQLAESLSTLPLPEDYALQELRTLTRSYLAEMMDS